MMPSHQSRRTIALLPSPSLATPSCRTSSRSSRCWRTKSKAAHVDIFKGQVNKAWREMYVAYKLVKEAEERIVNLRYAVEDFEWLLQLSGEMFKATAEDQEQKTRMEEAWRLALPKCCGEFHST